LFFGIHAGKDLEVVLRAFSCMPEWQLVVAGNGAAQAVQRFHQHLVGGETPRVFDGYLDEHTRALLYTAANLVVLSFKPSQLANDSGGLADAIGWERPVVCSDDCTTATIVRIHRLGTVFEPGNVDALVAAVRAAPAGPDPDGLAQVRSEMSGSRVAQQLLDALAQ
jgi:glycosyltransferase involved in cell wall biosynthesis